MWFKVTRHVTKKSDDGVDMHEDTVFTIEAQTFADASEKTIELVPDHNTYLKCNFDVHPTEAMGVEMDRLRAMDVKMLAELLKAELGKHPRLQKSEHTSLIESLSVTKDVDPETGKQIEESEHFKAINLLYGVTQASCQDAHGLPRELPEVNNLRVVVRMNDQPHAKPNELEVIAKVNVAFYSLDGSDGSDEIEVIFPVRDSTRRLTEHEALAGKDKVMSGGSCPFRQMTPAAGGKKLDDIETKAPVSCDDKDEDEDKDKNEAPFTCHVGKKRTHNGEMKGVPRDD